MSISVAATGRLVFGCQPRILLLCAGVILMFWLSNPLELAIKGINPAAAGLVDPTTSRVIYANKYLQTLIRMAVLGSSGLPFLLNPAIGWRILMRAPMLCMFFAYAACSLLWSDTPANSLNDLVYLATALLTGMALAIYGSPGDAARIFALGGLAIGVVSLGVIALFPAYGVHQPSEISAGAWRGVYDDKNELGQVMAAFAVVYLVKGSQLFRPRLVWIGALGVSLLLAVASKSAAALAIIALGTSVYVLLFVLGGIVRVIALLAMPLVIAIASGLKDEFLALLGRNADLSGRTEIWAAAWRIIQQHMVYGNGYGSATMGGLVPYLVDRFKVAHTHNGYLDLALSGGVIGSALLYGAVATAIYRAIKAWDPKSETALLIETLSGFLICWSVSAFSEVTFRPNNPMGSLGMAALVVLSSLPAAFRGSRALATLSGHNLAVRAGPA
ncbi:O-antigen ligase family protein [Lichenicoccus sp.]|uniref:O-antigen ligase family protein n=1 Tax=Lichenicoccus sp. TaxID=2781899 RepID=UPI003D0CAD7E